MSAGVGLNQMMPTVAVALLVEAAPRMYDALATIRALRDHLAEGGAWPLEESCALPEGIPRPGPDQAFDDWAADVADAVLPKP